MKNFSWSWSRLKNFRTCPKRHWHVDLQKDFKEAEGEALIWGHEVHKAMAECIDLNKPLPTTMQHYDWWPDKVGSLKKDLGLHVKCEQKLAMNEQFQPVGFFDHKAWFRGVVDVLILLHPNTRAAITIDWKTGKVNPEFEQLALSAQLIFSNHPEVDTVATIYVWFGHDAPPTVKTYQRAEMLPTWTAVLPEVKVMAEAHRTTTYPPRPSGLCIRHCPVSSCPHYQKGSH